MTRVTTFVGSMLVALCAVAASQELDQLPLGDPELAHQLASAAPGEVYDCRGAAVVALEDVLDRLAEVRVILLGESHTSMEQKLLHARILDGLAERGVELVLGMEFFQREDDRALQRWRQGELDDEELLREVGWYGRGGYRFEYYAPVMGVARNRGIPVIGLNVPRGLVRTVSGGGLEALSEEQRSEVGEVEVGGSPEHRYMVTRHWGDTAGEMPQQWLDRMYAAQCVWDVVMARSILDGLPPGKTMVVVVGSAHVGFGLGIPRRLRAEAELRGDSTISVATLCPSEAPAPNPDGPMRGHPRGIGDDDTPSDLGRAQFSRSLADYVAVFADSGGVEAYPRLGLRLRSDEQGMPVVMTTWPDSLAEGAGFEAGDRLLAVNGSELADHDDLRWRLARLEWGRRLGIDVERDEERLEVALLLYPRIDISEREIVTGWTMEPVAAFDAGGIDPVAVDAEDDQRPRSFLLQRDGVAERIEVWTGDRLAEAHELDDQARVIRSLFLVPRPDTAVEIRYGRGEDGAVVETTRFDRAGRVLGGGV